VLLEGVVRAGEGGLGPGRGSSEGCAPVGRKAGGECVAGLRAGGRPGHGQGQPRRRQGVSTTDQGEGRAAAGDGDCARKRTTVIATQFTGEEAQERDLGW